MSIKRNFSRFFSHKPFQDNNKVFCCSYFETLINSFPTRKNQLPVNILLYNISDIRFCHAKTLKYEGYNNENLPFSGTAWLGDFSTRLSGN